MLGSSIMATVLSGKGKAADVAAFATANGLSVVIDAPGTKIPVCILGPRKRKEADFAAVEAALAAGLPRAESVHHDCGVHHALGQADSKNVRALIARLERSHHGSVNLGIEPGASRLVVVDVDTAAEKVAFTGWLAEHGALGPQMTVASPGKLDTSVDAAAGAMVHSDGGHYWFELPSGVELPTEHGTGVMKVAHGDSSFTVMWANRQILIPPSVREEGVYRFTGAPITVAPSMLIKAILDHAATRAAVHARRAEYLADADPSGIDVWDAATPWSVVLEPDGWTDTGKLDRTCGCPVWRAPGEHGSDRSATAHEDGCSKFDTTAGWAPMHIWTDSVPPALTGQKTITKLGYLAAMAPDGPVERAEMCRRLGLIEREENVSWEFAPATDQRPDEQLPARSIECDDRENASLTSGSAPECIVESAPAVEPIADPFTDPAPTTDQTPIPDKSVNEAQQGKKNKDDVPAWQRLLDRAKSSAQLRDEPPLRPLINGVLDKDATFRITGPSGAGKTFVTLDMAASLATDQDWQGRSTHADGRPVVYVVAEGAAGFKRRLWAWEQEYHGGEPIKADRFLVFDFALQIKDQANWLVFRQALQHLNPCLVVLDTQARVTVGMEENSATDMGIAIERIDLIRRENPGACVGTVHHTGYDGQHGRGSTAVYGSVNTEIMISKEEDSDGNHVITASNEKQKDDAEFTPIRMRLRQVDIPDALDRPAAVIDHDMDPFAIPEPLRESLDRLPDEVDDWPGVVRACEPKLAGFNEQGWSITDLMSVVLGFSNLPEVPANGKRSVAGEQRARVRRAVDLMLSGGELERITKGSFRWPIPD